MSDFITVCKRGEIREGHGKSFTVAGRAVAVFLVDGQYYALNDYCPHMGASLGPGDVRDLTVICDRHGWAFRLADGRGIDATDLKAEAFETRVQDGEVQVRLP
jgi:nitrite reductase (NADH) small subunit/3-phenylpropionate/trans-cinnamate dioxygenase ferredoxin subunit